MRATGTSVTLCMPVEKERSARSMCWTWLAVSVAPAEIGVRLLPLPPKLAGGPQVPGATLGGDGQSS